jgi:hypothetical protein
MGSVVTVDMKGGSPPVCLAVIQVTMDDFADIPAAGDACVSEAESEEQKCDGSEGGVEEGDGKYRFNGKNIYVTWSKSKIDSKEEFNEKLLTILPVGVRYFGGRELHQDGTPHYHVVFSFLNKVHWPDAVKKFSIEGDTNAIRLVKPKRGQRVVDFLENTQSYCAKDGDTFGERLSLEGAVAEQRKRKWQDVIDEPDEEKAWKMIREFEPRAYMVNHPALERAMVKKQVNGGGTVDKGGLSGKFRVSRIMKWWMDKYVVRREWVGRPMSLLIVGDSKTGKSKWAESQGNPIVMNGQWCMKSIFAGATHVVVSDVKPAAFGYQGRSYWRDVLGGQDRFNGRDFQQETRTIEWGLPCIWTCNFDNDPRRNPAVADYMKRASYVFEVRDRPGERGWGKLYEPVETEADEEDLELTEALAEANTYVDKGEVDEAVDITNEFGI